MTAMTDLDFAIYLQSSVFMLKLFRYKIYIYTLELYGSGHSII